MGANADQVLKAFRGVFWKGVYEALGRYTRARGADFSAMNFGYDDGDGDDARRWGVDPSHPERVCLQLYSRVVDGVLVEGRDVVDVSCGRGGGLAHLARSLRPTSAIGFDFTPVNVELSRATFPHMDFRVGSALALPLAARSVDVVVSVEASHCYSSVDRFLAESARVLRDDGALCWTDFEKVGSANAARDHFEDVSEVDITPHVLRAMSLDRERRRGLIRAHTAKALWSALDHFAASSDDVDTVRRFTEGRARYFVRQCKQPRRL